MQKRYTEAHIIGMWLEAESDRLVIQASAAGTPLWHRPFTAGATRTVALTVPEAGKLKCLEAESARWKEIVAE